MRIRDLILIRSDAGDGGWSLHTPRQIAAAKAYGEPPEYLVTGPSEYDVARERWVRPNSVDYAEALKACLKENA